jgi:hypothetical protein
LNITGTNTNPITAYGGFDGNIYLNGTASSMTVYKGHTMTEGMIWANRTVLYDSASLGQQLTIDPSSWFGVRIDQWSSTTINWQGNGTADFTFTLSGLVDGSRYKVYVDGNILANLIANGGVISFSYSGPWSEHQFEVIGGVYSKAIVGLGVVLGIMLVIGVVVSVLVPVVEVAKEKRKFKAQDFIHMVVYIIISIALLGVVYAVLP